MPGDQHIQALTIKSQKKKTKCQNPYKTLCFCVPEKKQLTVNQKPLKTIGKHGFSGAAKNKIIGMTTGQKKNARKTFETQCFLHARKKYIGNIYQILRLTKNL